MKDPINTSSNKSNNYLIWLAIILALVSFFFPRPNKTNINSNTESTLERIDKKKIMRIGYEGYPPYTIENPKTGKLSGYSVDMANFIAKEAGWQIEWIKTTADTKIIDLESDKFDLMAEPIFATIPRAARVTFTNPYAYFGDAAAVVKVNENRFNKIDDLNNKNITVAVRLGYSDQKFAEQNLPLANIKPMKVDDINQVFQDVVSGNSDVALADVEQVKKFSKEHTEIVKCLFCDNPPSLIGAGFILRKGDFTFFNFLNVSIDYLESNSILDNLDAKYSVSSFRDHMNLTK